MAEEEEDQLTQEGRSFSGDEYYLQIVNKYKQGRI